MRRRVEKAATELGYCPNALASSLATRRTKLIGLVSNNFPGDIGIIGLNAMETTGQRPTPNAGRINARLRAGGPAHER